MIANKLTLNMSKFNFMILNSNTYHHISYLFIYLPSDVISQEKTATSSRSITKASKYAFPLKLTHKLAESKRYLVTW